VKDHVSDELTLTLSLKSVNHRFLDLHLRMPSELDPLEMKVRRSTTRSPDPSASGRRDASTSRRIPLCRATDRGVHRCNELRDLDRLGLITVEPRRHDLLAVLGHHRGRHRDHWDRACPGVSPHVLQRPFRRAAQASRS